MEKPTKFGLGVTAGAIIFALFFAVTYAATAEFSLKDSIANIAGTILGNKLADEIDAGELSETFGAFPGGDIYNDVSIHATFSQGGSILATTTSEEAAATLTAGQLEKYSIINYSGTVANPALTVTLPATSTFGNLLKYPGDRRTWVFENDFGAAATTTTIAAGTGIDLQEPGNTNIFNVVIDIDCKAVFDCYRRTDTDVVCIVTETSPAD